jgi:hypothetical protein
MRPYRTSIARGMAWVAIAAVNLAALRALYAADMELAMGLGFMALAVQFGGFQAIRRRGHCRAFWIGFVLAGLAAMGSFVWCSLSLESPAFLVWSVYTKYANRFLNEITGVWSSYNSNQVLNHFVMVMMLSLVWFLPQLIIATIVGLMARSIFPRNEGEL